MLARGFWLYVWRVETPVGEVLYVGRTGDSSSTNATAPYSRMGQHLGRNPNQNALRRQLDAAGVQPEECTSFELISCGPLFPEQADKKAHYKIRDIVAALEKELAVSLSNAGYRVLNTMHCRKPLHSSYWREVRRVFIDYFPRLRVD